MPRPMPRSVSPLRDARTFAYELQRRALLHLPEGAPEPARDHHKLWLELRRRGLNPDWREFVLPYPILLLEDARRLHGDWRRHPWLVEDAPAAEDPARGLEL